MQLIFQVREDTSVFGNLSYRLLVIGSHWNELVERVDIFKDRIFSSAS